MLESLFSTLAPHYCLSCGEIGAQICDNCFFDIELQPLEQCAACHGLLANLRCGGCQTLHGVTQIVLSERDGVLRRLVDDYKFACKRSTYEVVARCLDVGAPIFPDTTYIVPIPTSSVHIRQRSFDHTRDFSRRFTNLRGLHYAPLLRRRHNKAQVGASVAERKRQAETAFEVCGKLPDIDALYVLCDDIVTTGASMAAAVTQLRKAGARNIATLALLRQPWS